MKLKKIFLPLLAALLFAGCSAAPEAQTPSGKFDAEVDYLIVGGGAAGIASAVEAADQGIENIMIVEKTGMLGGAAVYSGGIFGGVETQVTQALDLHVDVEDVIAEQQREKHYILDEELTRLTIESAGKTIDWMIDTLGVQFQPEVIVKDGYGTFQTIHLVEGEGSGLREPFEKAIADRAIDVRLNTEATALIMEDGRVIGAECVNENGETIRIKAKAVLMATGGYSANGDLMAAVAEQNRYFQTSNLAYQTGDGLVMATAVGAGVQNLDQVQVYLREVENRTSQFPYMFTIFVGQDGRRFMDEKRTAQTWNQEIKDDVVDLYGRTGVDYFWSLADEASLEMMQIADAAKDHEGVVVADTLDELAQKTGIDAEALKATVDRWNSFAAKMEDEDYGRTAQFWFPISTGPYYALKTTFFSSVCHGGITKNQNAQVTRIDGSVIDGLYAAGEVTTVTNSNGYTISNAMTFGRIAAQHVAASIQATK